MVTDKVAYIGMYSIIPNTVSPDVLDLDWDRISCNTKKYLILPYKAKSVLGKVQIWRGEKNVGQVQ